MQSDDGTGGPDQRIDKKIEAVSSNLEKMKRIEAGNVPLCPNAPHDPGCQMEAAQMKSANENSKNDLK